MLKTFFDLKPLIYQPILLQFIHTLRLILISGHFWSDDKSREMYDLILTRLRSWL